MTYFLDGLLGLFELDDLRHRLACWCHVDGGWAVPRGWEPRFAGLALREQIKFTQNRRGQSPPILFYQSLRSLSVKGQSPGVSVSLL